jgi:hypothetical protein
MSCNRAEFIDRRTCSIPLIERLLTRGELPYPALVALIARAAFIDTDLMCRAAFTLLTKAIADTRVVCDYMLHRCG